MIYNVFLIVLPASKLPAKLACLLSGLFHFIILFLLHLQFHFLYMTPDHNLNSFLLALLHMSAHFYFRLTPTQVLEKVGTYNLEFIQMKFGFIWVDP